MTSSARLTEPIPTISCAEHEPYEKLPNYPVQGAQSDYDYISTLGVWAVQVAGVVKRNHTRRDNTAACLDVYRKRGVIL